MVESFPLDLHVLSMPLAFNLSQDQTLQLKSSHSTSKDIEQLFKARHTQTPQLYVTVYADESLQVIRL